jgi:ATP-binding cassette subfamily A (ABC1) protein 3
VASAGLPDSAAYFSNPSDYPLTTFAPLDPATFPPSNLTAQTFNQHLLDQVYPTPRIAESHYNAFQGTFAPDAAAPTTKFVDKFVVYFNTSCSWATSLGLNAYNAQVLRALGKPDVSITATIHPMPLTANLQTLGTTMTAIIVAIGFAFMPASFIAFAVKEEQDKVKHQQLISGVSAASYWAANFAWDFCNYMVMGLLCLLIFQIWGIDALIGSNAGAVFLAILLYGLSVIPFTYMASLLFSESTSAQNSMLLFYIFVGALLLIVTIVMGIIPSTQSAAYNIKFFFRLAPSYCFGECIANILTRSSATFFGSSKSLMDIDIGQ